MKTFKLIMIAIYAIVHVHFVNAVSVDVQKKYSDVLTTDDYGILTEADLWYYRNHPDNKYSGDKLFWQCVSKDEIALELSEDFTNQVAPDDNASELEVRVNDPNNYKSNNKKITYEYSTRLSHADAISSSKAYMRDFEKVMNHQKYVCFGGRLMLTQDKQKDGSITYILQLEGIKSKAGCSFYNCKEPHLAFRKHQVKHAR